MVFILGRYSVPGTTESGTMLRVPKFVRKFYGDKNGSIATTFAVMLIPILTGVGAAIDYSRANAVKVQLQGALDSALIAGAKDGTSSWMQVAQNVFAGNLASKNIAASTPTFTSETDSSYAGSVTASVATSVLSIIRIRTLTVGASGKAKMVEADNSCILVLDHGQPTSHNALALNGAPMVNLSGCSIRSNTSMDCNGHDGSSTKSYAAGTATGCAGPKSNAPLVPDVYASLSPGIGKSCGTSRPGVNWTPGTLPTGSGFITVDRGAYTEYHVCGDLTVAGSGYLTGNPPSKDVVVIIENGNLTVANAADVNTVKTTIVMTGDNNYSSKINFPNGSGKLGTLTLSASTGSTNPWQGVAIYLDPTLTKDVDNSWGSGAEFNAEGLVYLGNSNVVTNGNMSSSNSKCTKFVMNSLTTNGHVDLNFTQADCAAIGMKQWGGITVHLTQ
jgi:Flp pilus assembly protein TadG